MAIYAINVQIIDGQRRLSGTYRTLRKFRKDDTLVLFRRDAHGVTLTGTSTVESVLHLEEKSISEVLVSEVEHFAEERPLAVYAGSLQKVRLFLSPERHFRRKITTMTRQDLNTLITGQLDMERTIFRYIFSSLPFQLRILFIYNLKDP